MERVLNKSMKQARLDFRFIDVVEGVGKFGGNQAQYKNMLSMFDRLTIDDFLPEIAHLLEHEDLAHAIAKIKGLADSAAYGDKL